MDELGAMSPYMSMVGNAAGTALNYLATEAHASKQQARQEQMNRAAFRRNEIAVMNQAQLEKNSFERAGLNPADAGANGAPVQQAGSAGMGQSGMASVFAGLSELVAALKAPTEIEKMVAETGRTEAQTGQINDYQNPLIKQQIDKVFEDMVVSKNANSLFESQKNFLQSYTPSMFEQMMVKLKQDGTWESLGEKTRDTIEALAGGVIGLDQGALEGFKKLVDSEVSLSDADKQLMSNGLASNILLKQLNSKSVQDALANMPEATYKKLHADMSETWQHIRNLETSRTREEAMKHYDWVQNKLRELDSPTYLHNYGDWKDEKQKFIDDNWESAKDIMKGAVQMATGAAVGGFVGGKVAGKAAASASPSAVVAPTDKQILDINKSRTFGRTFDFR